MSGLLIYVASLADYVAGRHHGIHIELGAHVDIDEVHEAVDAMLASSPAATVYHEIERAEEYEIHDFEGFLGYKVSQNSSLETVVAVASAIDEHGAAMAEWLALAGGDVTDATREFSEVYGGEWESRGDWAENDFESCHAEAYKAYVESEYLDFDADGYVTAAEADGHTFVELGLGRVAVLLPRR